MYIDDAKLVHIIFLKRLKEIQSGLKKCRTFSAIIINYVILFADNVYYFGDNVRSTTKRFRKKNSL